MSVDEHWPAADGALEATHMDCATAAAGSREAEPTAMLLGAEPSVPRSRDPRRMPQDLYIWGDGAAELVRRVPDRELPLLRSPDPGVRAVLAADPGRSPAAGRILACDVDEVRLVLADAPGTGRDALDILLVGEYVASVREPGRPWSDITCALWAHPVVGNLAFRALLQPKWHEMQMAYLAGRNCRPELQRMLWSDEHLQWLIAVQPNVPDDLLLMALAHRKKKVRDAALRGLARGDRQPPEISWERVRAAAVQLPAARQGEFVADLPSRFLYKACTDPDPAIRLAAAGYVRRAELLRSLAADPSPEVRQAASRRLLDLLSL